MEKLWLAIFVLVTAVQTIFGIRELPSEKPHLLQELKHSPLVSKKYGHHRSNVKIGNEIQRCSIFCPIIIIFPNSNTTSTSPKSTKNITKSPKGSVKVTSKPTLTNMSSRKPLNQNGKKSLKEIKKEHPRHNTDSRKKQQKLKAKAANEVKTQTGKKLIKKIKKEHSASKRSYIKKISKASKNISVKKYSYHDLNSHQKRLVLKQLNLGNSNGKRPYEFREISTSLCRVVCLEKNVPSNTPVPQTVSTESSGDSDEDSYEEGEDTPIEATVKPADPQSVVIGGIRPFGPVNFNGLDDFGPSGELAKDIPRLGDKHNKQNVTRKCYCNETFT
ncbi:uncharacterized protein LOC108905581 isoform X1 [Anoplophora glabripennis]|uniref:uncharacterized protein LOC108905581 isoform X1 n=1 Tax=Anoplophora glabripennis TaxID=217634 RepID=UPI000C778EAA|nr:uncharacterized protein LOC108905581 isoform X1 [Anoplophora glabripennis]